MKDASALPDTVSNGSIFCARVHRVSPTRFIIPVCFLSLDSHAAVVVQSFSMECPSHPNQNRTTGQRIGMGCLFAERHGETAHIVALSREAFLTEVEARSDAANSVRSIAAGPSINFPNRHGRCAGVRKSPAADCHA